MKNYITFTLFCFTFLTNSLLAQINDSKEGYGKSNSDTAWVSPIKNVPEIAQYETYATPARGTNTIGSYMIYLPKEYSNTKKKYPVIYYLHGGKGDQSESAWFMKIMNDSINSGKMSPVIIVGVQALPIGWYCNANVGAEGVISGPVEDVIIKNLIPHIDKKYRTIANYRGRGLEGWSMGGFGALRLAFKYPKMFGFASSIAGAVIDFTDEHNPQYLSNTFGPTEGEAAAASIAYFNAVHPKTYAQQNKVLIQKNVKVRLVVGKKDWLYDNKGKLITQNFSNYLSSLGIKNEYIPIDNIGHMLPQSFEKKEVNYPLTFWTNAFKRDKNK